MFDIGFSEMLLLAAIALIALGPKQLPEIARVVGRFLHQFRKASSDFSSDFMKTSDMGQKITSEIENRILHPTQTYVKTQEAAKTEQPVKTDDQSKKS